MRQVCLSSQPFHDVATFGSFNILPFPLSTPFHIILLHSFHIFHLAQRGTFRERVGGIIFIPCSGRQRWLLKFEHQHFKILVVRFVELQLTRLLLAEALHTRDGSHGG